MTNIKELPENVKSKLKSGVCITSSAQCVEELVTNSIDAGSTCIAVRVDLQFYHKIQVIDNGTGIIPKQMEIVGKR